MRGWIAGLLASILVGVLGGPALAHERRQVGAYTLTVGWAEEPPYAGLKNAVQVTVTDAAGRPVTDLADALGVEVLYGSQRTARLPLLPAFGARAGTPGEYRALLIPTRPGTYTFHIVGSIHGQAVDQSFTSSSTTFDPVASPAEIEFPVKDPSLSELAGRVDRLASRVASSRRIAEQASGVAARAQILGGLGLLAGVVGLGVAVARRRT